jgi:hypothetical protein
MLDYLIILTSLPPAFSRKTNSPWPNLRSFAGQSITIRKFLNLYPFKEENESLAPLKS